MKAKEQIFQGDMLVEDDGELRRIRPDECGTKINSNPWGYAFDDVKIEGYAAGTYSIGEDVTIFDGSEEFNMQPAGKLSGSKCVIRMNSE